MLTERTTKRLQGMSKCSENGQKVKRVFQLMTNYGDLWQEIAESIGRNRGARTPGIDGENHAVAVEKLDSIREQLKQDTYRPLPVRRVYIPKRTASSVRSVSRPRPTSWCKAWQRAFWRKSMNRSSRSILMDSAKNIPAIPHWRNSSTTGMA